MITLIKEKGFPVYRKHKHVLMIVRFDGPTTGKIVMSSNIKEILQIRNDWPRFDDMNHWNECPIVEHDGVVYYDTQPVMISLQFPPLIYFVDATREGHIFAVGRDDGFKVDNFFPVRLFEQGLLDHWSQLAVHWGHGHRSCVREG